MDESGELEPRPATPPGWYVVDQYTERWWNGVAWAPDTRPRLVTAAPPPPYGQVASGGYGAYGTPGRAVTYTPRETNHVLHLILTLLTCGLWGFVWLFMVIVNSLSKRKSVTHYR